MRAGVLEGSCHKDGRSENPSNMTSIRIFSNNCRGYNSKKESIYKYVIEQLNPDVINLEETMLRNKAKINHKDYFSFCLNWPDGAGGGGIATMVANSINKNANIIHNTAYQKI